MEKPLTFDWLQHCPTHAAAEERLAGLEHFHLGGEAVLEEAVTRLGLPTRRTVIELGCGLGGVGRFLLRRNPELNISGYDTDERLCSINRRINRHLGLEQYRVHQGNLFEAEIPARSSIVVSHIVLIVGLESLRAFLLDKPMDEIWLLEPVRLGAYAYPQIWALSADTDLLTSREAMENCWSNMGFRCEAQADIGSIASNYRAPRGDGDIPSLGEIAPVADFAEKARNGKTALRQRAVSLMAWRYRRISEDEHGRVGGH